MIKKKMRDLRSGFPTKYPFSLCSGLIMSSCLSRSMSKEIAIYKPAAKMKPVLSMAV
jgi:hypothetical protein